MLTIEYPNERNKGWFYSLYEGWSKSNETVSIVSNLDVIVIKDECIFIVRPFSNVRANFQWAIDCKCQDIAYDITYSNPPNAKIVQYVIINQFF